MIDSDAAAPPLELIPLVAIAVAGDVAARDRLLAASYAELRRVARHVVNGQAARIQIQPTELLHDTMVRLLRLDRIEWRDRAHFFALAATMMRQVLIDQVRRVRADKRRHEAVPLTLCALSADGPAFDILALEAALERLSQRSEQKGRIIELRVYAGLTIEEVAEVMALSPSTVKRGWRAGRAWLYDAIEGQAGGVGDQPR